MASTTVLLAQAAVQLVSAVLYLWVGRLVVERNPTGDSRLANQLFATWWIALGLVYVSLPFFAIPIQLLGYRDLALTVTLLNVILVLIVVAVWGLVYYLLYLYTGKRAWFWPITVFYAALAGILLYLIAWLQPTGFDSDGMLTYVNKPLSGAPSIALGLAFSLPVVLAALGYGSLYFRVKEPEARYRVGLVAGAFLVQWGWSLATAIFQLNAKYPNSIALSMLSNVIAILAAVAIALAFRPPAWVRERIGGGGAGA